MEEYEITIKITISVPSYQEALTMQNKVTQQLQNAMIEDVNPITNITVKTKEIV